MKTVLITGGTGLVGTRLRQLLHEMGYQTSILSRSKRSPENSKAYQWDIAKGYIDEEAITTADYIIHLAGAGVSDKRWTDSYKKEIYDSRIDSTRLLHEYLQKLDHHVKAFISTSAQGYYRPQGDDWITEVSPKGDGFLAEVCEDWEAEALKIEELGVRTAIIRVGIVLSRKGGALKELEMPANFGVAAYLGSGKQYYSWIHIDDLCCEYIHLMESEETKGIYNGVAPTPERNKTLTKAITKAKGTMLLSIPAPKFALNIALGEMSSFLLDSLRCSAAKIEATGFEFSYPKLEDALADLYKKK